MQEITFIPSHGSHVSMSILNTGAAASRVLHLRELVCYGTPASLFLVSAIRYEYGVEAGEIVTGLGPRVARRAIK